MDDSCLRPIILMDQKPVIDLVAALYGMAAGIAMSSLGWLISEVSRNGHNAN